VVEDIELLTHDGFEGGVSRNDQQHVEEFLVPGPVCDGLQQAVALGVDAALTLYHEVFADAFEEEWLLDLVAVVAVGEFAEFAQGLAVELDVKLAQDLLEGVDLDEGVVAVVVAEVVVDGFDDGFDVLLL